MIAIPDEFWTVRYDGTRYPGASEGVWEGANCQVFAYALLRHFGLEPPPFRSSELWNDALYTTRIAATVKALEPLDLLLFNKTDDAYGAHMGVYVGDGSAVHLSRRVGVPAVWKLAKFAGHPEYRCWLGAKRVNVLAPEAR